jgi:hypothetical protein
MSQDRFFCSTQSRANCEEIYGTATLVRSWLLLEYPTVWRRHAVEDSWLLPPAVKRRIRDMKETGEAERTLLIRQHHRRTGPIRCFYVDSCQDRARVSRVILDDYEELLTDSKKKERIGGLLFAVCTHGRHDRCCAKQGIPVFCTMQEYAGERAWECSHVGGDRFAGNVVVFPYGIYYGRVTPADVPEIVRRSEMGEIWLAGYRGRSCFPRAVQVAEYYARKESKRLAIDEFTPLERLQIAPERTRVRFQARSDSSIHTVEYQTNPESLRQRLTCNAEEAAGIPQHRLTSYTTISA